MSRFIDGEWTTMSDTCDVYLYVETMPAFGAAVAGGAIVAPVVRRAAAMVAVKAVRREIFTVVRLLL